MAKILVQVKTTPDEARKGFWIGLGITFIMIFLPVIINRYIYDFSLPWDFGLMEIVFGMLLGFIFGQMAMYGWPQLWSSEQYNPPLVYAKEEE